MTSESFDERAATWDDDPEKVERARAVGELMLEVTRPDGATRVLEYGAGTGLLSQALVGRIGPLTMADPSAGMRQVLADKVAAGALPAGTRIWDVDLATSAPPEATFDLIVSLMTLHHIPDVRAALLGFAQVLVPGGRVCLSDLVAEDGSFHGDPDVEVHHGFDGQELGRWLEDAGFEDVSVRHAYDVVKDGRNYPLFLATATRP